MEKVMIDKKFYNFEEANNYAKLNSVIMVRLIDIDNDEILYHWFKYDNYGNLLSRKFWVNAYSQNPDDELLFEKNHSNSNFDDEDFFSQMWYEYL